MHGLLQSDTMAKVFEGEQIINPLKCQLVNFSGKIKLSPKPEN